MAGGLAAWVLGCFCSFVCLGLLVEGLLCLRFWVALGLGAGGVAGAFCLWDCPCYHDIKLKELKFLLDPFTMGGAFSSISLATERAPPSYNLSCFYVCIIVLISCID